MDDLLKTILVPEEFCILKTDSQRKMTINNLQLAIVIR
jgi:hypothetical protein